MQNQPKEPDTKKSAIPDEKLGIMIYGNLKIKDLDTGKILVNQRA
jgi:hypothetical protein